MTSPLTRLGFKGVATKARALRVNPPSAVGGSFMMRQQRIPYLVTAEDLLLRNARRQSRHMNCRPLSQGIGAATHVAGEVSTCRTHRAHDADLPGGRPRRS